MPFWHQKNDLCYNSKLSRREFMSVVYDYCRGISATQSSAEFLNPEGLEFKEQVSRKVSRQTISDYFTRLSECVLHTRGTYPWWSVDFWAEITEGQMGKIRAAVYNDNNIVGDTRNDFVEETGRSKTVDIETYIKILRKMSIGMNGLPKKNFWIHLGRACEIAYYIDEGYDDPTSAMFLDLISLFEDDQYRLFKRKESPTTRIEREEYLREREKIADERIYSRNYEEDPKDVVEKEWWDHLDENEREHALKKASLTVFDGDIEIPHKATIRRVK